MEIHFILNTFYGFLIYFLLYVFTSKLINFPFKEAGFYDPAKLYPVYARSPLANVFPADLKVLLIRVDLGLPIRKPFYPEHQRWVLNKIDVVSGMWRRENLVLNIAIGYPF